ncbi:MAG: hypothetical protein JXR68_04340 [Bacteroidales bacterium]|nr:hypothetical protein [Bacteroidales bacterium]
MKLKGVFKILNYSVSADEYLLKVGIEKTKILLDILKPEINKKYYKHFLHSVYLIASGLYSDSLVESFKIIENILSDKLKKNGELASNQVFSKAKHLKIISYREYSFLSGFRDLRNDISHNLGECSKQEAELSLKMATDFLKKNF